MATPDYPTCFHPFPNFQKKEVFKKERQTSIEKPSRVNKNCEALTQQSIPDTTVVHTKARGLSCLCKPIVQSSPLIDGQ